MDTTYAKRAAVLCTTADYFKHFRSAALRARRSLLIAGWDFQPDLKLLRKGEADDGLPVTMRDLIDYLATTHPDMEIRIISWNYALMYESGHKVPEDIEWALGLPDNVKFALDAHEKAMGSHHHKIVAIDDEIAFTGGVDLSVQRWDRKSRLASDPERVDPRGTRYDPVHDVQLVVEGDAAQYLAGIVRERWRKATDETLEPTNPTNIDTWPEGLKADFQDLEIEFARTWPHAHDRGMTTEIADVYAELFRTAKHSLYLENQYLTHDASLKAIGDRLSEEDGPEVVAVIPQDYRAFPERKSFGVEKDKAVRALRERDRFNRLRIVSPRTVSLGENKSVYVHSKLAFADDEMFIVGSANLSERSMRLDTELVAVIRGSNDSRRNRIRAIRERLLAIHLGMKPEPVRSAIAQTHSIIGLIDMIAEHPGRALVPVETGKPRRVRWLPQWMTDPAEATGRRVAAGAIAAAGVLAAGVGIWFMVGSRRSAS